MRFLVFPIYAPMASWGDVAVGEYRPTHGYPSRSAVLGMLAAALGVTREDEAAHAQLADDLGMAVAVYSEGSLLRDYHTAQSTSASDLKKRPHRTRSDELAVAKEDLHTILSTRDYRQDAFSLVLLYHRSDAPQWTLDELAAAIEHPCFALFAGRKACPLALPLAPVIVEADTLMTALAESRGQAERLLEQLGKAAIHLRYLAADTDVSAGLPLSYQVQRKDALLSRKRWQFGDRPENVYLVQAGSEGAA
jgi:CRISPR system Cascade subunit CasD